MFLGEGFAFERNHPVCPVRILRPKVMVIIFEHVPDIKEYNEQFELLPQVNPFVIDEYRIVPQILFSQDDKGKKSDR